MLAMSALNEPVAKRIAKIFRMLSSDQDGDVLAAVTAMKRLFKSEGLSFHDIATVIESCNGEIEEKKYSDKDAEIIFARGMEKGIEKGRAEEAAPPEFYDADGRPRWNAIVLFCQKEIARLYKEKEREFVEDMAGYTLYRQLSEKQQQWLMSIFVKLGGRHYAKQHHV
jgi:hypothetical protein